MPSWPGGAGGEEEQGCCKEAGALEKEQKPTQLFNLCFYNLPVIFVPIKKKILDSSKQEGEM